MVRAWVLGFPGLAGDRSPAGRMVALGRHFCELAESPREFRESTRRLALAIGSGTAQHLELRLAAGDAAPDFWRRDVEDYIAHIQHALTCADFDVPFDLKKQGEDPDAAHHLMRKLVHRYGELLIAWPAITRAAAELAGEGMLAGEAC